MGATIALGGGGEKRKRERKTERMRGVKKKKKICEIFLLRGQNHKKAKGG